MQFYFHLKFYASIYLMLIILKKSIDPCKVILKFYYPIRLKKKTKLSVLRNNLDYQIVKNNN